jgi:hypothetical protein
VYSHQELTCLPQNLLLFVCEPQFFVLKSDIILCGVFIAVDDLLTVSYTVFACNGLVSFSVSKAVSQV